MNITSAARHCEFTPGDRQAAHLRLERFARFLREREQSTLAIHLVMTGVKSGLEAEVVVRVGGHELVAREISDDARGAVESAAEQIEQQMRRLKERAAGRRRGDRVRTADGLAVPAAEDGLVDLFDDAPGGE